MDVTRRFEGFGKIMQVCGFFNTTSDKERVTTSQDSERSNPLVTRFLESIKPYEVMHFLKGYYPSID